MTTAITATQTSITTGPTFDVTILAGQVAPSPLKMYRRDFAAYADFVGSFALAMNPATLAQWRAHLANETSKSLSTINRMLSAVRKVTNEAAAQGYIAHETAEQFGRVTGVKAKAMKSRLKANARTKVTPE